MKKYEWESPIYFEGIALPGVTIAIDHINESNIPDLSPNTAKWLWRFTICSGVTNKDNSQNIIKCANEALISIRTHRNHLMRVLPAKWDGKFDESVIDEWEFALVKIIEVASGREFCEWYSA